MFFSTWSKVYAVDAVSGETKWSYDPEVPGEWARKACCDVVNRGVAVYKGRVYVGTLDGRLVALDAATGAVVWEVDTLIDRTRFYTITGAPRVANGKVFIGNGGAEFGVRGYVTAYDAESGEEVWRFFTVPGDPSLPFEHRNGACCRNMERRQLVGIWRWRHRVELHRLRPDSTRSTLASVTARPGHASFAPPVGR